ncbi:hypothetical protein MXD59_23800 [Frankia sp. Ag45/Mut15]|uniref:Uncharacterized protein n=1 Tax=Frankia umida TaxID=573489 RepID=A0ABT0K612_9ACTN|nr:hypothetical protein [Frankia umida]MCK9878748.1 hypothetical protein [Frankia umida]
MKAPERVPTLGFPRPTPRPAWRAGWLAAGPPMGPVATRRSSAGGPPAT